MSAIVAIALYGCMHAQSKRGAGWRRTDGKSTTSMAEIPPLGRIGHRSRMGRAALIALILANAGFGGDQAPRVASAKQPRPARIVERATTGVPAGWRATRDRDTGALAALWGGSIEVPGALVDAAIAERAARAFATQLVPAGTTIAQFTLAANRVEHGKRTVVLQQEMRGLPVIGAQISVVFAHDRLFYAASTAVPGASEAAPGTRAQIAQAAAWLQGAGIDASVTATGARAVLPLVYGPGELALEVVDVLDARAGLERWTIYVKPDGTPVMRVGRVAHGSGTVRLDVPVRHPLGSRTRLAAGRANLVVDGVPVISSSAGAVTWNGAAAATVVPSATGELVRVINEAGPAATGALILGNGGTVDWSLATDAEGDAQLTAYAWTMAAKTKARAIHPTLSWLDRRLDVHVNEPGSCNALSDGDSLHFFGAGACENAARVTDVVLHEFGHSFHAQSFLAGGTIDGALGEGLADFFAAHFTGDPGVGRGLHFDDQPVRELDPEGKELRFPDDVVGDQHLTGLIVAGALWDLRKNFIAFGGGPTPIDAIYLGIVEHATDLSSAYLAALVGDDNDGDLGNGTPHQCSIEQAFAAHGLVADFETTTLSTPVVDGRTVSVDVRVPVSNPCPRAQVVGVELIWQVGEADPQTIAMTGTGTRFTATLPELAGPAIVRFRVVGHLDDGGALAMPDNPADPMYQRMIGTATPLACDLLDADPAWKQSGRMAWEWAQPQGRAGDPPAAFTGERVLGTNLTGSGRYPAGSSAITMPAVDTTGFADVHLQFRRWLTVEDRAKDRAAIAVGGQVIWENASDGQLDHVDREWRFVDLALPAGGGDITWSIDANSQTELGGWNVDDICVVTFDPDACVGPDCVEDGGVDGGCCSASNEPRASTLLGLAVLGLVLRRRRARRASSARQRTGDPHDRVAIRR